MQTFNSFQISVFTLFSYVQTCQVTDVHFRPRGGGLSLDRAGLEAAVDWTPFCVNLPPIVSSTFCFTPTLESAGPRKPGAFRGVSIETGAPSPPAGPAVVLSNVTVELEDGKKPDVQRVEV